MRRYGPLVKSLGAAFIGVAVAIVDVPSGAAAPPQPNPDLPDTVRFNRDIRPILSDTCFACHGPDEKQRKGDLRLDTKQGAFAQRDKYALIVPGQPDKSEVYLRLVTDDADERMPHRKSGKTLSPRQIALVKKWIEQGAQWQKHWSLIPPTRPVPPKVGDQLAGKGELSAIDRFILARLEREVLAPTPEADRRTLIRRLSFDLTGLPPTPAEVEAFVNDPSPNAYETLVDRLLASPAYGERMTVFWLDLVRYADSIGYHSDNPREVCTERAHVINAFNENKPFNQFAIEQIAGDLLPNATQEQRIATGYNMMLQTTEEGGAQPKEYAAKYVADRVRNFGEVWLAATTGCCQCHDHKFDPFTTKDFYSLGAFFADIQEPAVGRRPQTPVPTPEVEEKLKVLDGQIAAVQKALDTQTPALDAALAKWEASLADQIDIDTPTLGPWHVLGPFKADSFDAAHDTAFGPEEGEHVDPAKAYLNGKLKWKKEPKWEDGKPIDLKGDNSATYLYRQVKAQRPTPMTLSLGSDDSIRVWVNGKQVLNNKVSRGVAPDQEKVTVNLKPGDNDLLMKICNGSGGYGFYFNVLGSGLPNPILAILRLPPAERTDAHKAELGKYYRSIAPELAADRDKLAALEKQREAVNKSMPTTLLTVSTNPRTMRILPRGNWQDDSGPEVQPATPAFMEPLNVEGRRANRLDLAQWLVRGDNPMAARAFVNRLWKLFYGNGIARTLDDIGSQGPWPTHPDLLDWLAVEFVDSHWDIKHMVKLMVMSRTYRQGSTPSPQLLARDPYNKLFARQSAFRLDAEMVRDNALATSGLLVRKIGGPSVKPYQPAGYWAHLNFPQREWQNGAGDDLYRRGLYTWWQRSFLQPSLLAFDAPSREECTAERPRSNTPQQALVLLNDPTYVEAARVFAHGIVKQGGGDVQARLAWAFQRALQRDPREQEVNLLTQLHAQHLADYQADAKAAAELIGVGDAPTPNDVDPADLAAWTSVARVILNLHETITRY